MCQAIAGWLMVFGLACSSACLAADSEGQNASGPPSADAPAARAIAYLSAEVPRWRREHPCYSCHNNGDAARALLTAARRGHSVNAALADTLTWLEQPGRWDANATGGGFDDKALARIQFAGALTSAVEAQSASRAALKAAARIVAADQADDGSWRLDSSQSVGSPATYGTALATWSARRTLVAAADGTLQPAIDRADRWLRTSESQNVLDAAAIVLGLERGSDEAARVQRRRTLDLLARGQSPDGGWGPYATAAPEPFDTAVAILALASLDGGELLTQPAFSNDERRAAIARARRFLIDRQLADGSWPETTRPARQESYAQRISTAAWATLALLASAER